MFILPDRSRKKYIYLQIVTDRGIQGRTIIQRKLLLTCLACLIFPLDPQLFGAGQVLGSVGAWLCRWHLAVLTVALPSCLSIVTLPDFNHLGWNFPFCISASHQTRGEHFLKIILTSMKVKLGNGDALELAVWGGHGIAASASLWKQEQWMYGWSQTRVEDWNSWHLETSNPIQNFPTMFSSTAVLLGFKYVRSPAGMLSHSEVPPDQSLCAKLPTFSGTLNCYTSHRLHRHVLKLGS